MEDIRLQAEAAARELLDVAGLKAGDLLVIGCSSSEIGQANLVCARTRPKFIGGERAHYVDALK